jgi:hypothetical protein
LLLPEAAGTRCVTTDSRTPWVDQCNVALLLAPRQSPRRVYTPMRKREQFACRVAGSVILRGVPRLAGVRRTRYRTFAIPSGVTHAEVPRAHPPRVLYSFATGVGTMRLPSEEREQGRAVCAPTDSSAARNGGCAGSLKAARRQAESRSSRDWNRRGPRIDTKLLLPVRVDSWTSVLFLRGTVSTHTKGRIEPRLHAVSGEFGGAGSRYMGRTLRRAYAHRLASGSGRTAFTFSTKAFASFGAAMLPSNASSFPLATTARVRALITVYV